jgi:hypothetical protein
MDLRIFGFIGGVFVAMVKFIDVSENENCEKIVKNIF